jgi:hypothetical protein
MMTQRAAEDQGGKRNDEEGTLKKERGGDE